MATADPRAQKIEEAVAKLASASRSFSGRAASQAGVDLRDLIDPNGEAVASLVDVEKSAGAAALALPIDMITFESWVLGHLGDRDELDLDVNTHRDVWFGLGAWLGETLRARHGGFWLIPSEEPATWRIGFTKILLEIAPHAFAEKLLRAGAGLGKRVVGEVERLRQQHEDQEQAEGGKAKDKYGPQHYARLHTVPLAQWLVLDMARLSSFWREKPVPALKAELEQAGKRLPPQNAPVVARIAEALGTLDQEKPAAEQVTDRGLFEAVAQIIAMRRATPPVAIDVLEKLVLPALHVGFPDKFPPLGDDDLAAVKKGADLFAVFVEVCPYAHQAQEGGFLGTFPPDELGTPYPDRQNIDVSKGDWVALNPGRLIPMLEKFEPKRLLGVYDRFVAWLGKQEGVPRLKETGRGLAESTARTLGELRMCLAALDKGCALVFRLLPPPG